MKQSSMKSFWDTASSLVVNSTLGRCEDGNISSSDFDTNPDPIHNDLQFPTQKDVEPSTTNIIEKVFSHERFNLSFPSEDRHKVILMGPNQPHDIEFHMTENGGIRRSFQPKWFDMPCAKPWLEYFTKAEEMFCFLVGYLELLEAQVRTMNTDG